MVDGSIQVNGIPKFDDNREKEDKVVVTVKYDCPAKISEMKKDEKGIVEKNEKGIPLWNDSDCWKAKCWTDQLDHEKKQMENETWFKDQNLEVEQSVTKIG